MNSKDSLPVILVSACDRATAENFITDLIDNEVKEAESGYKKPEAVDGRIWRLINKYYRADVLVRARGDDDAPTGEARPADAHVIYFTPQECSAGSAACAEARAATQEVSGAEVRVAALCAAGAGGALGAWAPVANYEPVPLLGAAPQAGPFGSERGVARVRAALHAHLWRGLRRLDRLDDRPAPSPPLTPIEYDSSAAEDEDDEEDEAAAVERAEEFVRVLGALGDAGLAGAAAGATDAERRARAEQVVAALCRALGHDLDAC